MLTLQGIEIASLITEYQVRKMSEISPNKEILSKTSFFIPYLVIFFLKFWLDQESQHARALQDYISNDFSMLSFRKVWWRHYD